MSRIAAGFLIGLALGVALGWLLFRGSDNAELRAQRDQALHADSLKRLQIDSLTRRIAGLIAFADSLDTERTRDSAAIDSLKRRPVRVRTVYVPNPVDTSGPLIPIEVVDRADFDTLHARCDRLNASCAATIAAKNVVIDSTTALADSLAARADSLRRWIEGMPIPREPSRWSLGAGGGYGVVLSNGQACTGPGVYAGFNFSFR